MSSTKRSQYNKVLLCHSTTQHYSILHSTTPHYKVLYNSKSTTAHYKVLLQYYSSTTPYYKVLLQYYSVLQSIFPYYDYITPVLQSTTPLLLCTTKYYSVVKRDSSSTKYYSRTTPYYTLLLCTTKYYTILRTTQYHPLLQSTTQYYSLLRNATLHRTTPYYKALHSIPAIDPANPARGCIQQNQDVRLATGARAQKFANVRFATAACTKMYEISQQRPRHLAAYKNHCFTTVLSVRCSLFALKVARRSKKN